MKHVLVIVFLRSAACPLFSHDVPPALPTLPRYSPTNNAKHVNSPDNATQNMIAVTPSKQ
jgi:hypothetical protein